MGRLIIEGLFVCAGVLMWLGITLKLDAFIRRRPPRLLDWFQPSVADEAQRWLDKRTI